MGNRWHHYLVYWSEWLMQVDRLEGCTGRIFQECNIPISKNNVRMHFSNQSLIWRAQINVELRALSDGWRTCRGKCTLDSSIFLLDAPILWAIIDPSVPPKWFDSTIEDNMMFGLLVASYPSVANNGPTRGLWDLLTAVPDCNAAWFCLWRLKTPEMVELVSREVNSST